MINFEEELKKFHPSPEVEDITETILLLRVSVTSIHIFPK